jgi:ATP-dependent phosphofructokinase / diphosphate-dependent phosphofructokinase
MFVPLYFEEILDPETKRARVRMVNVGSEYYYIARRYMLRLNRADFDDPHELAKYAATCGISLEEFKKQFFYLIENDEIYKAVNGQKISVVAPESNVAFNPMRPTKRTGKNNSGK